MGFYRRTVELLEDLLAATGGAILPEKPSVNITRPNDVIAYAAGDIINSDGVGVAFEFDTEAVADKKVQVVGGHIVSSFKSITLPDLELLLFKSQIELTPDNSYFRPTFAQLEDYLGSLYLNNFKTYDTRMLSDAIMNSPEINIVPAAGTSKFYGVLVSRNAWTPGAVQELKIMLDLKR